MARENTPHQRGVIHHDLKPANIRVDAGGKPRVLDFDLAKAAGTNQPNDAPVQITGEFMGTPAYASPKPTRGCPHLIDLRTDVYSLGVILYAMRIGQYRHQVMGQMGEDLKNVAEAEPKRPSPS